MIPPRNGPIREPPPQATAYIPIAEARSCKSEISETNPSDIGQNSESPDPQGHLDDEYAFDRVRCSEQQCCGANGKDAQKIETASVESVSEISCNHRQKRVGQ